MEIPDLSQLSNIVLTDNPGTNPGIPYKGKIISIPKNLLPEKTEYSLAYDGSHEQRILPMLRFITAILNNQTEILSFLSINQIKSGTVFTEKYFEEQKNNISIQLEQNRKNIFQKLEELKGLYDKKQDTIIQHSNRIINLITEIEHKKDLDEIKNTLKEIKKDLVDNNNQKEVKELIESLKDISDRI
uniref:Uncharacterized protein n=1 Tax=Blueberry red ringspot virus TaxID=172220 RepID=A0A6H1NQ90_9VIRU|nr:hypothetical protein [Blueberry red ringspot virus]QIZ03266.1 hypothetical protein [Blueberry red ringspot virus]QIZ03274.1 hypothetical protein [Blueberry red ringspot virus]QIZ03282.1 hypothetical protein [Blueberry red ringspot virus]QIZ03298.1 hypothetical protein [Blueberry red ringspot virus]